MGWGNLTPSVGQKLATMGKASLFFPLIVMVNPPRWSLSSLPEVWPQWRDRLKLPKFRGSWQQLQRWFTVDEEQVAAILESIRQQLPPTEVLLLGKPQAGKSSLVRGLTGLPADMVGQGFRPHTQHMSRYAYPSEELPLLVFTDTVGLGEAHQDLAAIAQECIANLQGGDRRGQVLILVVKINDFATDRLHQILKQIRQACAQLPVLLAVSCLHEAYPSGWADHPPYPPKGEAIARPLGEIEKNFQGLCDRLVPFDFTREEDDFNPVFYGETALKEAIAALLPEAEARTIHQLLDDQVGQQLGGIYRDVARNHIGVFAGIAGTLAAVPLPFTTMPVLTVLQTTMVITLGKVYGQTLSPSQAGGIVSAIAGGFLAQMIGRELVKFVPVLGSLVAASWAGAYTWALGEAACVYFGDLLGHKKPDPQRIQQAMKAAFTEAQQRLKEGKPWPTIGPTIGEDPEEIPCLATEEPPSPTS